MIITKVMTNPTIMVVFWEPPNVEASTSHDGDEVELPEFSVMKNYNCIIMANKQENSCIASLHCWAELMVRMMAGVQNNKAQFTLSNY